MNPKILIGVGLLFFIILSFKIHGDHRFKAGEDSKASELLASNQKVQKDLNSKFQQRLQDAIRENESEKLQAKAFIDVVNDSIPKVDENEIDLGDCNIISDDFAVVFNNAIGEPLY